MSTIDEIKMAIGAHGQWKQKLRDAIETGQCESTPERVKQDNNCSFGKWLHYRIDESAKHSPFYKEVLELHASFHEEAGAILELALKGHKEEAKERIKTGSEFARRSSNLILTMTKWRDLLES